MAEMEETVNTAVTWATTAGLTALTNFVVAALMLGLGSLAINLLSKGVEKTIAKAKKHELLARFVGSVISKSCWAVLIVAVLGRLGVNVGPLVAGLGVTGFILGFAFQESLANLAAGMMIAINNPFKVGDYVILAGLEGSIVEVDMMATIMTTGDNKKIVVPNKVAWGSPITNFSAMKTRRVETVVGISYGADISKAKKVALEAIMTLEAVRKDPEPIVEVMSLDDSAVTLVVRAWVDNADYWPTFFAANQAVKEAFDKNGIEIPFPQMDVHVKHG